MTNQFRGEETVEESGSPRERLIAAATRILAERGLEEATVKEIARAANVNQGLVHYYFGSKEALLVEVVQEAARRSSREMAALRLSTSGVSLPEAALLRVKARTERDPDAYRLRYELFALALRHPALREEVASLLAKGREGIGHGIQAALGEEFLEREGLAAVLLACYDGLALQKLIDPDFDLDGGYRALAQFISCLAGTD